MKTFAVIRKSSWLDNERGEHGWGNGYVFIPKEHILYGKSYETKFVDISNFSFIQDKILCYTDIEQETDCVWLDDLIKVHGSINLSESMNDFFTYYEVEKYPFVPLDDIEGIDISEYWVFGFSTDHSGYNSFYCNKEYVIEQTRKLQKQLEEFSVETIKNELNKEE